MRDRDPDARARLVAYERTERAQLERAVRWQYEQSGVTPTFPVELAALAIQALDRGIFLARLLDEDIPALPSSTRSERLARSEGVSPDGPPDGPR